MNGKTIVASIVVGILGLISTIVGLLLEVLPHKNQVRLFYFSESLNYDCIYFRSPAFFMVVAAIVCLIVALIVLSISADCGCGRGTYSSSSNRGLAILNFIICWLMCIAAIILFLLAGATQYGAPFFKIGGDISLGDTSEWIDTGRCYKVRRGVFGATAALSFVGITLGIISYIALVSEDYRARRAN